MGVGGSGQPIAKRDREHGPHQGTRGTAWPLTGQRRVSEQGEVKMPREGINRVSSCPGHLQTVTV